METATLASGDLDFLEQHLAHIKKDVEAIDKTIISLKQKSSSGNGTQQKYTPVGTDQKLLSLLGTQPVQPLSEEKRTISDILRQRFAR